MSIRSIRTAVLSCSMLVGFASAAGAQTQPSLPSMREAFQKDFLIGVCLTGDPEKAYKPNELALIESQFSEVTPENCMKPGKIHPAEDRWNFGPADALVAYAQSHNMVVYGHTLCWHIDAPKWFFRGDDGQPASRDVILGRLKSHITTLVQHFKGKVRGWDVVNEAISDKPNEFLRPTNPWVKYVGDDYVVKAYQFAHEADPDMELQYNDYDIEFPQKRAKAVKLIQQLQAVVPLKSVGIQGHWQTSKVPFQDIEDTITTFEKMGLKVAITELDLDALPRKVSGADLTRDEKGSADPMQVTPEILQTQAERYEQLFRLFLKHKQSIIRVGFWGIDDAHSWLDNWPMKRVNAALPFDRQAQPKPAFYGILKAAQPN